MKDQAEIISQNRLKRRRRALRRTNATINNGDDNSNENKDGDDEDDDKEDLTDPDNITKQYIPEIVLEGFTLNREKMRDIMNECLKDNTPKVVIDLIIEYACLYSIGGVSEELLKTRVILRDCYFVQFVIFNPVLELVVRNCGGADIQILNIERTIRVYNSKNINIYTKGECTSYRFEKCSECMVEGLDTRRRILFMNLFSDKLGFKIYNAYFPNDASKCVAQFGYDPNTETYVNNDPIPAPIPDAVTSEDQEVSVPVAPPISGNKQDKNENDNDNDEEEKETMVETSKGGFIDGWKKWFVEGNQECSLVIFRKDIDVCSFGQESKLSLKRGASMIPLL